MVKRIDIIYQEMINHYQYDGVTTNILAEKLNLARANVSTDLNYLVDQGRARKVSGKPVIYYPVIQISELDKFVRKNASLKMIVDQARAAVLYPPSGLNMLFYGETGVGKSMFASIIYDYAKFTKKSEAKFPFVHFNCADYANNPQLLLAQLFGVSKNAYTGAEKSRKGLIEEANGGILFLDEIHRLPPEGQEMFFTFIDRGVYSRLGEAEVERKASVQIIAATTESPDSALLQTFQRRIPMVLKIPNLAERTIEERANLVTLFFQQEANRLNEPIKVSQNSIRAFVSYHCPNNIGQLKNDIQLACAKSYADFIVTGHQKIMIHSPELPPNVLNGLYGESDLREKWDKLQQFSNRYLDFYPEKLQAEFEEPGETIYDVINTKSKEANHKVFNYAEISAIVQANLDQFYSIQDGSASTEEVDLNKLKSVITEPLFDVCLETIKIAERLLDRKLNPKIESALAIHIFTTYNRVRRGEYVEKHPDFTKINQEHPNYIKIAKECLIFLNASLDIVIPEEEASFLGMFFIYDDNYTFESNKYVRVIAMTHGDTGASSMVAFVNTLLNTDHAWGINMNIDESPVKVIERLKALLTEKNVKEDILFLVDMGSLTNIGIEIEKDLGNKCKTIALCSTPHVLEATRKAILGYSLEQIYRDTLQVNAYYQAIPESSQSLIPLEEKESVILTFCLTGEGTAKTMKNILQKKLQLTEQLKIIPVTLFQDESVQHHIEHLEKQYQVLCIVSSLPVKVAVPQFQLYDLFNQESIDKIQELVDVDLTYREISDTLVGELEHLDSEEIVTDVKILLKNIEKSLATQLSLKAIFGLIFHLSCLVDRLQGEHVGTEFPNKAEFKKLYQQELLKLKQLLILLEKKYEITIPEDEMCYILSILIPTESQF